MQSQQTFTVFSPHYAPGMLEVRVTLRQRDAPLNAMKARAGTMRNNSGAPEVSPPIAQVDINYRFPIIVDPVRSDEPMDHPRPRWSLGRYTAMPEQCDYAADPSQVLEGHQRD